MDEKLSMPARLWLTFKTEVVRRLLMVALPLVVAVGLPWLVDGSHSWFPLLEHAVWIWFVVAVVVAVNGVLRSLGTAWLSKSSLHDRPLKGLVQILQVLVVFIGGIVVVSILIGRSPLTLITGLGAFAAVLMLVFKDSILGFVAGVLLAENDMVHLGDWIEMPANGVNGVVTDVSLTIVKVRNWDNSIVTVPPYALISESFVNWRGMLHSGGRRITCGAMLVTDYIKPCTTEFLEQMKMFDADLALFITAKQRQAARGEEVDVHNPEGLVDGSIRTNAGLLRAYLALYLRRHKAINAELLLMVRTLPVTENGLPLQLYCFTHNKVWSEYEAVQAELMEHLYSVLPAFELHAYQNASLRDNIINGLLEGGCAPERIRDLPWGIV